MMARFPWPWLWVFMLTAGRAQHPDIITTAAAGALEQRAASASSSGAAITTTAPVFVSGTYNPKTKTECVTGANLPQCTRRSSVISAWAPTPLSIASYIGDYGATKGSEYYSILGLPCPTDKAGLWDTKQCSVLFVGTKYSTAANEQTTSSQSWFQGRDIAVYRWTVPAMAALPYTVKDGVVTSTFYGGWACTFDAAAIASCTSSLLGTPSMSPWAWQTLYDTWTVPAAEATPVPLTVFDAPTREEVEASSSPVWYTSPSFPDVWAITARNSSGETCPSPKQVLDTFAIVNVLSTVMCLVMGNQFVVRLVTCGLLGRHSKPHWSWGILWVFPFGMHMAANAAVAALLVGDAAYKTKLSHGALTMLFLTRPRVGPLPILLAWQFLERRRKRKGDGKPGENPYASSAFANLVAELLLQTAGLYIMGLVVHDGVSNGRYIPGRFYSPPMDYYLVMLYVAALCYMIFCCIAVLVGLAAVRAMASAREDSYARGFTALSMFWQSLLWIMSWVFWNGYVKSAGSQYCPPKLAAQATYWISFSAIGSFLGASG